MKAMLAIFAIGLLGGCFGGYSGYGGYGQAYQPPPPPAVVPSMGMAGYGFAGYPTYLAPVDPMALAMPVPPSNMCFLHRPPPWCTGPRCLPVGNETDNDLQFSIDGIPIDVPEAGGILPRGMTCWVIADAVGLHEAEAYGYIGPPPLQRATYCRKQFNISATGAGHHGLTFENLYCSTISPQSSSR